MKTRPDGIRPDKPARMRWLAALTGTVLALTTLGFVAPAQAAVGPDVAVTLSFDDANADQSAAVSILDAAGLKGTFYVPSGFIGAAGYLTRAQLTSMAASGHEIGGHTVNHTDLTTVTPAEASRQVCTDRATLTSWGFPVTSFAYPYAGVNAAAEAAVSACGYNSARGLGDIETPFGCAGCGFAETVPPGDPFYIKAPDQVATTWTLDNLKATVTNAETTGGWVELTFHHVCATACDVDGLSVTPATLTAFTTWLAARSATNNTTVKTVNQVIGGAVKPVVGGTTTPAPGPGVNGVQNPSLETVGTDGVPSCFKIQGFGTNTPAYTTVAPGHTGQVAEKLTMTNYASGDSKLMLTLDLGTCAPTVTPGHTYSLRAWYNSTVPTQFNVQKRDAAGLWTYWTDSPFFPASGVYAQAEWTTPVIPADVTAIAFGLNLFQNGQLVTDDYALYDSVGAPPFTGNPVVAATPTITGTAQVGSILTAVPGAWSPGTAVLTYQWLRNGTAITGATAGTYTVAAADAGTTLTVTVTGTAIGFTPPTATATSAGTVIPGTAAITVSRLAGPDRFATAVKVSQQFAPGVSRVYIANGLNFPDGLSSASAAAHFASPVLLTEPGSLPASVKTEIQRLKPKMIVVAGGPNVVSDSVLTQLKALGTTVRLGGADRYETSRLITQNAFASATTAYVASGQAFPDALTATPAAAKFSGPVILVPGGAASLDTNTLNLLKRLGITKVKIAGGVSAVSSGIENSLKSAFGAAAVGRFAGSDRYGTAIAINKDAFGTSGSAYLASGGGFADALGGGALASMKSAPLYLSPSNCVLPAVSAEFTRIGAKQVVLLGSEVVLNSSVQSLVQCQ